MSTRGAVLASFWRRPRLTTTSGTPSEWLESLDHDVVVEVLCECTPALAATRFTARTRHPSHLDGRLSEEELRVAFTELAEQGAVLSSSPVIVNTDARVDPTAIAARVRDVASSRGWTPV